MEQESIESIVKRLEDEMISIKSKQNTDYKSIVSKKTWNTNPYDVYVRMNAVNQYYRLTVKSVSGDVSPINMRYFYRWNNPNVMADPYYRTSAVPEVLILTLPQAPSKGTAVWDFRINMPIYGLPPPADVYIKLLFEGTDDFTYTWQQI